MRVSYPFIAAAFVLTLPCCADAGSDEPTLGNLSASDFGKGEEAAASVGGGSRTFGLGDPVNFDAFEITLKSVKHPSSVGVLDQRAAEGGMFVAINYTLENTGTEPLTGFDHPTLLLMDGQGRTYSPDDQATTQYVLQKMMIAKEFSKSAGSDLNPGLKFLTGAVWEIAANRFDRETWKVVLKGHEAHTISLAEPAPKTTSPHAQVGQVESACVPELANKVGLKCS